MASNNDSRHLERLRRFYAENEALPSYAELGRLLGFGSKSSGFKFVERLIEAGLLTRGARGPKPTEHFLVGVESDQLSLLPLIGRVAAGTPVMTDRNYEDYRRVDPRLFRPRADYLLKVRGDSMRDAGILDGDLLAVHSTPTAHHGQIVVARIEDEITVKRFEQRGSIVLLKAENPAYQPIRVDLREQELAIEGVYAGLLRPGAAMTAMRASIAELVRTQPGVWLGSGAGAGFGEARTEATGWPELDRMLPGGGWPAGALTELYCPVEGIGEFSLLLPLLVRLTGAGKRVVLVSPPHVPYSQALSERGVKLDKLVLLSPQSARDTLWAAEQTLRCAAVGLVVAWPQRAHDRELRRLQLAAETSGAAMIVYRPLREARTFSPAALRVLVRPCGTSSLELEVLKSRGGHAGVTRLRTAAERA